MLTIGMVWRFFLEAKAHLLAEPTVESGSNPYDLEDMVQWHEYAQYLAVSCPGRCLLFYC
jgi:hypothetical protein